MLGEGFNQGDFRSFYFLHCQTWRVAKGDKWKKPALPDTHGKAGTQNSVLAGVTERMGRCQLARTEQKGISPHRHLILHRLNNRYASGH